MNTIGLAASQPPLDSGDIGVGVIYFIVFVALICVICSGKDD